MADGSVEIRISGSVDGSLAASANEAKTAVSSVGDAATVAATTAQQSASATMAQAAAFASTTNSIHGNTIAMRESLVVGRELLRGNLTRLPGSLSILAQQFAISGKSAGEFAATILKSFGIIKATQDAELAGLAASAAATANVIGQTAARTGSAIVAADAEVLLAEAALRNAEDSTAEAAAQARLAAAHQAVATAAREAVVAEDALAEANIGVAATARAAAGAEAVALGPIAILAGVAVVIGTVTLATIQYEEEQKKLTAITLGLGAQSGLTADQLKKISESADSSSQSIRETTKAAEAFAATGIRNEEVVKQLSTNVEAYSQLIGGKFADAQKRLAEAMKDPVKGAQDLHEQLGILNGDQLEQIRTLVALGDKDQAVAIITQALKERIDQAKQAGVGLRTEFGTLVDVLSNVYNSIGQVSDALDREAGVLLGNLIPALHQAGQAHRDAAAAASEQAQNEAALNKISALGKTAYDATPEGRAAKEKADLQGNLSAARDALKVDQALVAQGKEKADVLIRDRQAIADYTHATSTYLTEVQKKTKADAIDVQIAAAKHAHNKELVADLTQQKALLEESGKIESDADARALAKGKGDLAGARTFAPKGGKGPSIVSEWTEQLHAAEVASNDFFADQTEKELQFWEGKVGQVKKGSKEWLEVQSKIYEAEKSLAHRAYDEHLADLNSSIEADRDNFKKAQTDWETKLAFIKSKYREESTEYKTAHREFEAFEREHQQQMLQAEREGEQKRIEALKQHLAAEQSLRNTYARAEEEVVKAQSEGAVLSEVRAAARIGQIHLQLAQEELADADRAYAAENAARERAITAEEAAGKQESTAYKNMLADKANADQQYYDHRRQLEAQAYAQQIQDILAVRAAYSNYVSGTVSATIAGLDGMLSRTQNWRQAVIGVYQSVVSTLENALSRMVTKWVVEHVFMTSAQRAQLAIQNAQQAASETAKTAVTTTGVATRAGVENTGFFAKILGLLGINLGAHTGTEAAKTAATATGAATRAAAEDTAAATSAATQIATNVTTALSYAAVAGAAGTASWAAAPWPIDAGAPAFGAAMYADAAAYAALASLDVGTNYLPRDQVVQMHEGERVIPKADNTKLIQMMAMASGGIDGGGRADVHLHYQPNIHERERLDMRQLLASGGGDMISFLHQAVRDGKLKLAA